MVLRLCSCASFASFALSTCTCGASGGDALELPYVNQLSLVLLDPGEVLVTDSEDMQSCFNLFEMPAAWNRYFAFSKQVPASAFGGDPNTMAYVCMRSAPMGWIGAVGLMQNLARRCVFRLAGVPAERSSKRGPPCA